MKHLIAVVTAPIGNFYFASAGLAEDCAVPERQQATKNLMKLVENDTMLKYQLEQSIALGQRINDNPMTNPVANLDDYYDFIDALVTYNPQNIMTGTMNGLTRVSMDGKNFCNWNILDMLAYSYFLVDRQLIVEQIRVRHDC